MKVVKTVEPPVGGVAAPTRVRRMLNTFPSDRNRMSDLKSLSWNASLSMAENTNATNSGAITQPCLVPFVTDVCP